MRGVAHVALVGAVSVVAGCGGGGGEHAASGPKWHSLTPAKLARTEVAAARVGRFVYVMGGFLPDRTTTAATERYDIKRDRWSRVAATPVPLNHAAAATYKGKIYVV